MKILRRLTYGSALLMGTFSTQAATLHPATLTIGSDLTYPPYNYLEKNKPAGFDEEFMSLLSKQLGLKNDVLDTRFSSLILGIKMHKFDIIASTLYVTPERAQQVAFMPYMKTGGALMVDKNSSFVPKTPEELCGKRVSSIKGGAWIARLAAVSTKYCQPKGLGAIVVREFPTSPEATQALLSKAVDVQYEDTAVAMATVSKTGQRLKISSTSVIYPVVVGLALNKDNPALLADLKKAFAETVKNGSYNALLNKYNVQMPSDQEVSQALAGTL